MFADMEYDHLDYSRPGTSWKPHYQRMANGFEPHSKDTTNKDRIDNTDWNIASLEFLSAVGASSEIHANVQNSETEGLSVAIVPICDSSLEWLWY
jgi:hypothetical protein